MAAVISTMVQAHIAYFHSDKNSFEHLVLQRSPDRKKYPSLWQTVTGSIEPDETAVQACLREVFEETGLHTEHVWSLPLVAPYYWPPDDAVILAPVFGLLVNSENVILSEEHRDFEWLGAVEAEMRLVMPSQKQGTIIFEQLLKKEMPDFFKIEK